MEWKRGPTLGRGSTATVSLATASPSGELFAVKTTELSCSLFLQKEKHFLSQLSCPRIVKYIGFDVSYEDHDRPMYNLCMEYVPGGTLYDAIQRNRGCLDEPTMRTYTKQILQGLEYLHANGLVHCDIKSQNILIGKDGSKIADLGCAKSVGEVDAASALSGTPMFMAPEVARGEEQGFPADVWALGCTVIEMATGSTPWPDMNDPVSALYRIGFSGDLPAIPSWLSEKGKDFLSKCLRRDPRERWTAKELLYQHPFLAEVDSDHSVEIKEFTMSSPNSVLEQGFWDSLEVLKCPRNLTHEGISSDSPAERIKRLIGGTVPSVSCVPTWTYDEDWVTVRSNGVEEDEKFSGEFDVLMADESVMGDLISAPLLEELENSIFDEDLFVNSADSFSTITATSVRRGFMMACESVKDDIVLIISNCETDNEKFCLHPSQLFDLNTPKSIEYNLIFFVQNISIALILRPSQGNFAEIDMNV
ncbi:mitogen-activated protein kinase kinase kinase 18 [Alnus glutinosa]|uniref:mitogen-activated protein kinase kinase kinase 18 n=1 Tax=Alnus glutinosa TaxID=3517 RepID=UPI002D77B7A0|nr:mitogen-activated protein kinase kinase kinase 18 [Alnus glutinosa]